MVLNIDQITEVKRMRYFDKLFLMEDEFNLEQSYHIRMRRLHNRYLHTRGIVWGLKVEPVEKTKIKITPGMALNRATASNEDKVSQEIYFTEKNYEKDLAEYGNSLTAENNTAYVYVYITVTEVTDYIDKLKGGDEEIHWWEKADVVYSKTDKLTGEKYIYLAKATLTKDLNNNITVAVDPADADRIYAGAYGKLVLPVDGGDESTLSVEGKSFNGQSGIQVNSPKTGFTGNVDIVGDLNVTGSVNGGFGNIIVDTDQIKDDAVTADKIKDGSVGNAELASDAVTADKIKDGSVGNTELASDAVTTDKIKDGSVGNAELASDAVTADKIKDDTVTEAKLEPAIRTKLDSIVTSDIVQEIKDARGIKSTLGNRLDESLTAGGQLRSSVVGMDQLDYSTECQIIPRIYRVPLLRQTLFSRPVPSATIPVGTNPYEVAFDGSYIWVANSGGNTVSKIDIIKNTMVATVAVGLFPVSVAFDGTNIWVANYKDNTVSKVDISSNNVVATIAVGLFPVSVAFDGTNIWVANYNSNTVSKIDISNNDVRPIAVGANPDGVAFDGSYIWVANSGGNTVSKIDIINNAVIATVAVPSPHGMAFDGMNLWVANAGSNTVSKIDVNNNTVVATVAVGKYPQGLAFDGTHIWVSNYYDNTVSKIDISNNIFINVKSVAVGTNPIGVAFDGTHIWVANYVSNNVTKITKI